MTDFNPENSTAKAESTNQKAQTLTKSQVFWRRLTTTAVLWTVVLVALFSKNAWLASLSFYLVFSGLTLVGLLELSHVFGRKMEGAFPKRLLVTGGLFLTTAIFLEQSHALSQWIPARLEEILEEIALTILVLALLARSLFKDWQTRDRFALMGCLALGWLYVPWLLGFLQKIRYAPDGAGSYYLLLFILVTKFSDMGAYAVGSLIGKHKMIPRISPGKTWEGFFGAIVVSTLGGIALIIAVGDKMPYLSWEHALFLGPVLGAAAVMGDLVESHMKRGAEVKDSGNFLPGIGGALDLIDSLLFNAPLMFYYLTLYFGWAL
jgi:phosphatidate cytidylyltransferase